MNLDEITNDTVLGDLFLHMPPSQRAVQCSVAGDPSTVEGKFWGGIPWAKGTKSTLRPDRNNYVAISGFSGGNDGWRRRKDQFAATYAIMVDDVGTKLDAKRLDLNVFPASMAVETSPGNYQVTYMLDAPQTDQVEAEDVIKQLIAKLTDGGADPGMSGVTRVLRLPVGINGKPKYTRDGQVWRTRLTFYRPDIRVPWESLCRKFDLAHKVKMFAAPVSDVAAERKRGFGIVKHGLENLQAVRKYGRGWMDISCPWRHDHTDRSDTGAAVAFPMQANGWYGGFKCHHGHCADKGWADLEDWVFNKVEQQARAIGFAKRFTGEDDAK